MIPDVQSLCYCRGFSTFHVFLDTIYGEAAYKKRFNVNDLDR